MNYLDLFNAVARVARPAHHDFVPIDTMDLLFVDSCFDSLDMIMIGMFMAMIYDIEDEIAKEMNPTSMQEMYDQIQQHKRRDPESLEWALEQIQ